MTPGTRLGHYEIVALIGSGGMGEVYRARDTKLQRDVALKVLPSAFTSDPERLARFEREAKALASLNHPGIAAIYGIEEGSGVRALVLELVDGESLAQYLLSRNTRLPVDEALSIARQLADALDAAHEKGVIHRDLKPANVGMTSTGVVKVLDFGLAKTDLASRGSGGIGSGSGSAIAALTTIAGTSAGSILGTVQYMSPEQARGRVVDKRTDIWSFGCLLFEMLTGQAVFGGATASDSLAAILEHEPDWQLLPPDLPPRARQLLQRCLRKDVRRRLRDIGDAIDDLTPATEPHDVQRAERSRPIEFHRLTDLPGMNGSPAISPDGKMVAFVALAQGRRHIWIRLLSGGAPLQVTRDDLDHLHPRWAPDSSTLIYHTPSAKAGEEGTLWEVSALGGLPRPIVGALGGGDISHDGRRIAFIRGEGGRAELVTVARDGFDLRVVFSAPIGFEWKVPRWSPDDQSLAFFGRGESVFEELLHVVSAAGGTVRVLARAAFMRGVSWLPDGTGLVFSSSTGSTLLYPPTFNLRRVSADGAQESQITFGDVSFVDPDVHASGRVLVCRIRSESDIWKIPFEGAPDRNVSDAVRVTRQTGRVQTPSLSPDGSEVVYLSDNGGHGNLWVSRTDGTATRQLTFENDRGVSIGVPRWSPTGDYIAFIVNRGYPQQWIVKPDGRGMRQLLDRGISLCWSLDGRWVYYCPFVDGQTFRIERIPFAGGPAQLVRADDNAFAPVCGDGVLFYAALVQEGLGTWAWEFRRASPDDGAAEFVARVESSRVCLLPQYANAALSPDGKWMTLGLVDGAVTNLWAMSTERREWRQVTDYGEQPTMIARQVSWSPDGKHIYAAVSKDNGDVVMFDGLI